MKDSTAIMFILHSHHTEGHSRGTMEKQPTLPGSSLERQGVLDSVYSIRQLQPMSLCWVVVWKDQIKRLLRISSFSHFHHEQMDG